MTIETLIADLTTALEENTKASKILAEVLGSATVTVPAQKSGNENAAPAAKRTPSPRNSTSKPADEPGEKAPTFEDAKAAVLKVAAKGREQAVELLARFGVTKVTDLKPEQYADVIKACGSL